MATAVLEAKRAPKKDGSFGRKRELTGLVLVALGLMVCLALVSYHPSDPSLNTAAGARRVHNWIGPVGATIADLAHQFLGVGAYMIAWIPMAFGLAVLLGRDLKHVMVKLFAAMALAVVTSALIDFAFANKQGGWLGEAIVEALSFRIGRAGAAIALSVALIAFAIATLNFSFARVTLALSAFGANVWRWTFERSRTAVQAWLEARAERKKLEKKAAKDAAKEAKEKKAAEELEADARAAEKIAEEVERMARIKKTLSEPADDEDDALPKPVVAKKIDPPALKEVKRIEPPKAAPLKPKPKTEAAKPEAPPEPRAFSPLDDEPQELGNIGKNGRDDDEPGEFGAWPDVPEVLAKQPEREWQNDVKAGELTMRAAAGPLIVDPRPGSSDEETQAIVKASGSIEQPKNTKYELPDVSLLNYDAPEKVAIDSDKLLQNAKKLERKLKDYGIDGAVVEIRPGPVVTMYEFLPAAGIKVSKIASLSDDLAMAMEAMRVRIVAPIPGKGVVGIEIPNERRETVFLKEIVSSEQFKGEASKLMLAVGKDIEGKPYCMDLGKAPHMLVAGATGSGKSVSINTIVLSILYRATPDEVRLLMVDPKMLELSVYQGIPHLLLPVVTDPKKAALALRWAVEEMERRYALLSEAGVRNIAGYNKKVEKGAQETLPLPGMEPTEPKPPAEKLPYIVIIIDELADLMMVASREVETSIARLAQMARAAGIHLILATQRPSVDVLTGVIKANFPARMSFQVASRHDSRTILDCIGAENLLGMGDMLLTPPGVGGLMRAHGAYVSEVEIQRVVEFLKTQGKPQYDENILKPRESEEGDGTGAMGGEDEYEDELYDQAVAFVAEQRYASVSMIQRRMRIGYNRAARLIERMEKEGIVGPGDGAKPREVLIQQQQA
ncbi:MAG: DNA translocase FtsK [Deltaproteobacteria bacterium]|nr:DNA translocase FtsK [Deltaproteobacteria bacterium]